RALVDLDPVPLARDQVVAALGTLHVMRPALGLRRGLLHAGALLAQQLGVTPGEVFLFVAARLIGHRPPGVEGDLTVRVSPPGRGPGPAPRGGGRAPEGWPRPTEPPGTRVPYRRSPEAAEAQAAAAWEPDPGVARSSPGWSA